MSVAVGQEFWMVAANCEKGSAAAKDQLFTDLKARFKPGSSYSEAAPLKFAVPDGEQALSFGSFDNLIRLTDELAKSDSQVESIVHRMERQYLELDPAAEFLVQSQRERIPFLRYLQNWRWDEAKYPRSRVISDNITMLMTVVNKLDEEARNKTAQYNELKTQKTNLAKKDNASLLVRDLVDVLTPDQVKMKGSAQDDFVFTEHLTTVCLVIPRGGEQEFLKMYESMQENVVPRSARKFEGHDDKDGNSLWRVVMFRSAVEGFKKQCRECGKRFSVRDFEYSEEAFKKLKAQRDQIEEQVKQQNHILQNLYQAAWSDSMVAWIHVKAMRVFVESVLRYGMPPSFAAFIIQPRGNNPNARRALADVMGKSSAGPFAGGRGTAADDDAGEEYYPYVSFNFCPFTVPRPDRT